MATAPAAAPAPDDGTDPTDAATPDTGATPTVLFTVMDNGDGTFTLIQGGPDADDASGDGGGDTDAGASGDASGTDTGTDNSGSQGQTFDSAGALLKGILDLLKQNQDGSGGGSSQSQFAAGFSGGDAGGASQPAMAQKY